MNLADKTRITSVEITWTVLLNTESIYIYNMDDIYIIWMIYI